MPDGWRVNSFVKILVVTLKSLPLLTAVVNINKQSSSEEQIRPYVGILSAHHCVKIYLGKK